LNAEHQGVFAMNEQKEKNR